MRKFRRWWRQVTGLRQSVDGAVKVLEEMRKDLLEVEAERREEASRLYAAATALERSADREVDEAVRARGVAQRLLALTDGVAP